MYIKPQTVIPPGTKITKLPPSSKKVPSLYSLERRQERQLEFDAEMAVRARLFAQYVKEGYSVEQALELVND